MENGFRIAVRGKTVAQGDETAAEICKIVYFAIENDAFRTVFVKDRLMAAGKVDDAQTTMTKSGMVVQEESGVVRTAVSQGIGSPFQETAIHVRGDYSENTAHLAPLIKQFFCN
jgi:hypothetical protein